MKNITIILASGNGSRFGQNIPKQFYKIDGKTVLEYSIEAFQNHDKIDEIIIVSNPDFVEETTKLSKKYSKVTKIVTGGETRQQSSYNGVYSIDDEKANVLIHDAARPFVSKIIIDNCIAALHRYKAVNVAIESSDTIVEVNENNLIKNIPVRKTLRRCQTPQCFDLNTIKLAHKLAKEDITNTATDDCSLVLRYKITDVYVVEGSSENIKVTYPEDIKLAHNLLRKK